MKILITGASGFIGRNLTERLLNTENEIIGIDIKEYPNNKCRRYDINEITSNFRFIWDDINNIMDYHYALEDIDSVYHLAASADIKKSSKDTRWDLENNTIGTHSILDMMRIKNIKNLIFASSSAVYGEGEIPMKENMADMRPISLYGASKIGAEAYINAYVDLYGFKASMFRFANVVGKYEHRGVIPDMIKKLRLNKEELEVLGDGKQTKSYFMVEDCIDALLNLKPEKPVAIYNLGAVDTMTVTDLVKIICEEFGVSPFLKYTGGDRGWIGDVPRTIVSIEKALTNGWKPKYNCEQSIRKTVRWLLDN